MSPLPSACVVSEARACVLFQPVFVPVSRDTCGSWLVLSSSFSWLHKWLRWHPWRTWSDMGCRPSWNPPRCSWRRSLLRSRRSPSRVCALGPARVLLLRKAAPGRARGSILLYQRRPCGLSVKSCPAAPPNRSVSTHRWFPGLRRWPWKASKRGWCDHL